MYAYSYDQINEWTEESELKDALKIAYEYKRLTWMYKSDYYAIYKDEKVVVGVFYELVEKDGLYTWEVQWNNEDYHYCVKSGENNKLIRSKYYNGTCSDEWSYFKLSSEVCDIYRKSKLESLIKAQIYSICSNK